jgi:hypothetical protein
MKKIFFLFTAVMLLSSCADIGLFHRKVKESSVINSELVPLIVKESFQEKYPEYIAEKWFKVNTNMYAVQFELKNRKKYAYFSNNGVYIDDEHYDLYDDDQYDEYMEDRDYFDNDMRD